MPGIILERTSHSVAVDLVAPVLQAYEDADRAIDSLIEDRRTEGDILCRELSEAGVSAELIDIVREYVTSTVDSLDEYADDQRDICSRIDDSRDAIEGELDEQHSDVRSVVDELISVADQPDRLADHVGPSDLAIFGPTVAALRTVLDAINNPVT